MYKFVKALTPFITFLKLLQQKWANCLYAAPASNVCKIFCHFNIYFQYGYSPKGSSVILYRSRDIRKNQVIFVILINFYDFTKVNGTCISGSREFSIFFNQLANCPPIIKNHY